MGIVPVLPGSTWRVHSPAVVQPHEGWTLVKNRVSVPVLVKIKVYFTGSPALTFPKSYTGVSNWILEPPTGCGAAGAGVAAAGAIAVAVGTGGACSAANKAVPVNRTEYSKTNFAVFVFIIITAATMAENSGYEKLNLRSRGTRGIPGLMDWWIDGLV